MSNIFVLTQLDDAEKQPRCVTERGTRIPLHANGEVLVRQDGHYVEVEYRRNIEVDLAPQAFVRLSTMGVQCAGPLATDNVVERLQRLALHVLWEAEVKFHEKLTELGALSFVDMVMLANPLAQA